ncbi:MAG TPA: NUDIX domain-containing protein [Roseiflexaceae bacterium]|nr:NUDIX domain-containing protein [Roseiflexaceae bacterium]
MHEQHLHPTHRYAVGGVVYRYTYRGQLEVLLIKKQAGSWSLPKGHIEANEQDDQALARELREETGLEVLIEVLVHRVSYEILKRGQPVPKTVSYYLVRPTGGRLRPGRREGIRKARWFKLQDALDRIPNERVRDVLDRAGQLLPESKPRSMLAALFGRGA